MEKIRSIYIVLILILISLVSCTENEPASLSFDEDMNFAIYTNPEVDCGECVFKAVHVLNETLQDTEKVQIIVQKGTKDSIIENFKNTIKEEAPHREFAFLESRVALPHPSIFLVKNKTVYMFIYLPIDPYLLKENISMCRNLLMNFDNAL